MCRGSVRLSELGAEGDRERAQVLLARLRLHKDGGDVRVADRERRGQRQDAVAHVFFAPAAQGRGPPHVAHIVAGVVEHAEQVPEAAQLLRAGPERRAHLEHASGVLARDASPVLDPEGLPPQPPLHTLGHAQPLQELGVEPDVVRVVPHHPVPVGHDIAGRHERRQEAESRVQGEHAAPVARSVEDVVDDQGDVVEHLEHSGRADQGGRDGSAVDRAIAAPDGQGAEVLRAALELPLQEVADLVVCALDPPGDLEVELTDLGFEPGL